MTNIHVVIADDDASMVALLERLLTGAGHTVLTCDNGAAAFELVQQHSPVLLITDWEMPGLTGLELCRKIRASHASGGTYILLLTGNEEQAQVVTGLEAGADDYLVKTCGQAELLARVRAGARLLRTGASTGVRRTLGTKIIMSVALVTFGVAALAGWNLRSTHHASLEVLERAMRIHELGAKIVHMDEVLTMSARMAAATGDLAWEERYRTFEPKLDDAIKDALDLAPSSFESESAAQTDAANIKLVEMENQAFAFLRQDRHEAARDLLSSKEYEEQKRIYAVGMQAVRISMRDRVEAQMDSDQRRISAAAWAALAALTVMASAWLGVLLVVGKHIRECSRAEGALQEAYELLETRVKQRTADLGRANEQLSTEIAQRVLAEKGLAERADLAELGAEVGVAMTRGDSLRAILQMCAAAVVQHLDAAFARVWTLNEKEGMLELQASAGMYTHIDGPHGRVPVGTFKIGLIAQERRPHLTNDVRDDPRIGDPDWARREGMVAFAGHPLIVGDRLVGVMALFARRPLSDIALKSLGSIADGIALGIQRRQAEEQQRRLVRALEAAAEAIILTDVKGNILQVNPAFTKVTGYTADEAIDQTPSVFKSDKQNPEFYERMWRTIQSGEVWAGRVVNKRKNGAFYVAELTIAPITVDGGTVTGYVGVQRDVTRQVEREEELAAARADAEDALAKLQEVHAQLMQADKMASIGHLAAGVAHEINNPIGFITSNLNSLSRYVADINRVLVAHDELLLECQSGSGLSTAKAENVVRVRKETDLDYVMSDLVDLIAESTDGAKRVRQIVADLKDFSHVDSPDVADEDINALLDKTVSVAWNELKYKTEVVKEYGDVPCIPCYGGKLGQVFLNLLVNAAHAIEEKGKITIRTALEDDSVCIEIADTGIGIPEENLGRIFDPFFTTKAVGSGTGLGLHLTFQIIKAHAGRIDVDSTVGQGTTFRIELPMSGPPEVKEKQDECVA